jgi:hypothetical protein
MNLPTTFFSLFAVLLRPSSVKTAPTDVNETIEGGRHVPETGSGLFFIVVAGQSGRDGKVEAIND